MADKQIMRIKKYPQESSSQKAQTLTQNISLIKKTELKQRAYKSFKVNMKKIFLLFAIAIFTTVFAASCNFGSNNNPPEEEKEPTHVGEWDWKFNYDGSTTTLIMTENTFEFTVNAGGMNLTHEGIIEGNDVYTLTENQEKVPYGTFDLISYYELEWCPIGSSECYDMERSE